MAIDTRRDITPALYRTVLGHFPTGVAAITSIGADGAPVGMTIGSFVSVSLDPPLVAFLPDKGSSTFPKIREAGFFCVNVLGADQEHVCRAFAARGTDKFAGLTVPPAEFETFLKEAPFNAEGRRRTEAPVVALPAALTKPNDSKELQRIFWEY